MTDEKINTELQRLNKYQNLLEMEKLSIEKKQECILSNLAVLEQRKAVLQQQIDNTQRGYQHNVERIKTKEIAIEQVINKISKF